MNKILSELKKLVTIKTLVSIVSVGAIVPLCKALYWTFETSYFGYFGVSPEVFSRPLFSSGFISVWLFVTSMSPILIVWSGVMTISFVFLVSFNYEVPKFPSTDSAGEGNKGIITNTAEDKSQKITKWARVKAVLANLADAVGRSITIPFIFWASGLIALLAVMFSFVWADKKGRELAKNLVDDYISKQECKDGFNNRVVGCFEISGIKGSNHFVLTNGKTHLIYLSHDQELPDPSGYGDAQESEFPKINIIEKSPGETFKIRRTYKIREPGAQKTVEN